jgi:hypothetical protein
VAVWQSLFYFWFSFLILILELGTLTATMVGHTAAPTQATFSSTGQYCITTAAAHEAMIWNLNSNTRARRLSLQTNVVVNQVQNALCDLCWMKYKVILSYCQCFHSAVGIMIGYGQDNQGI